MVDAGSTGVYTLGTASDDGSMWYVDLNQDGVINTIDLALFRVYFLGEHPDVDFNGDGAVSTIDLAIFRQLFLSPLGPSAFAP